MFLVLLWQNDLLYCPIISQEAHLQASVSAHHEEKTACSAEDKEEPANGNVLDGLVALERISHFL